MKLIKFILVLLILAPVIVRADGQKDNITLAIKTLKGYKTTLTSDEAVSLLEQESIEFSNIKAMNALGVSYSTGIGTEYNFDKAVRWFLSAASLGSIESYHNLGILYKNSKDRAKQNFMEACRYFKMGADSGSIICNYNYGFMLYKGLGCKQDYLEAIKYFKISALRMHAPSLYMLGLCYRNGYGVAVDLEKAKKYLLSSAKLGYKDAMDELKRKNPENRGSDNSYTDINIPATMPEIDGGITSPNLLLGNHSGVLIVYDWSGKNVIKEMPVSFSLSLKNDSAYGEMFLNNQKVLVSAQVSTNGALKLKNSKIYLNEYYSGVAPIEYQIDHLCFEQLGNRICGKLALYSMELREPERPMYIEIFQNSVSTTQVDNSETSIFVNPNPFDSEFIATFKSDVDIPSAEVRIFNQSGVLVFRQNIGALNCGINKVHLSPNLESGLYVLNIQTTNKTLKTLINKK